MGDPDILRQDTLNFFAKLTKKNEVKTQKLKNNLAGSKKILKFAEQKRKACDSSSVGRASASQAEGRGFEPRLSLSRSSLTAKGGADLLYHQLGIPINLDCLD